MSSEEAESKKRKRKASPLQHLKRGDKSFYVVNAKAVDEKVYSMIRIGEPSTNKDETLTIKNLCFALANNEVERLLVNPEGKFRIPSDKELTLIFSTCKKKEDVTFKLRGKDIKLYDPRWTKGGLKTKWDKKKGSSSSSSSSSSAKNKKKKPSKKKTKVTKEGLKKELVEIGKKLQEIE